MKPSNMHRLAYAWSQLPEIRKNFKVDIWNEFHWGITYNKPGYLPVQFYPSTGKWVAYDQTVYKGHLQKMLDFAKTQTEDKYFS